MNKRILRTIPLTVLGTWFIYKLYKSSESDFIFDGFVFLFIGVAGLSFLLWTILKDKKEYKLTKKLVCYLPTLTGMIFILLILSLNFYQDRKMNSPTLLSAFYDGGFNGFSIDLKDDGNYVMANGSGLGQYYLYGTYTILDSIITLDKSNIDNIIKTNRLAISTSQYFLPLDSTKLSDKPKANYITQIDKNGKEIEKEFRLRITKDNRTIH